MAGVREPTPMDVLRGERIRMARESKGLSAQGLADQIGVALRTVYGYEKGTSDPKSDGLILISKACGCTIDYLLGIDVPVKETKKLPVQNRQAVSRETVAQALRSVDLLDKDGKLSDEDLAFLLSVGEIIRQWFTNREHADESL